MWSGLGMSLGEYAQVLIDRELFGDSTKSEQLLTEAIKLDPVFV